MGLLPSTIFQPRVAAARRPWASRQNAFGVRSIGGAKRALQILQHSDEGRRILSALENEHVSGGVGKGENEHVAGLASTTTETQGSERRGYRRVVTVAIKIDLEKARKEHFTDYELANIIHHELRHAEIHTEALEGEDLSTMENVDRWERRRSQSDKALDIYLPSDLPTRRGTGCKPWMSTIISSKSRLGCG